MMFFRTPTEIVDYIDVELTHEMKFSRFNLKNNRIFNHYRVIFDFNMRLIFMMLNVILPENFLNVYSEHSPAGRILYLTFLHSLSHNFPILLINS